MDSLSLRPMYCFFGVLLCPRDTGLLALLQTCQVQHLCTCCYFCLEPPSFRFHVAYFFNSFRFLIKFLPFQWVLHWLLYLKDELYLVPFPTIICMIPAHTYLFIYLPIICLSQEKIITLRAGIFFFLLFLIANSPMPESITKLFIEWMNSLSDIFFFYWLLPKFPRATVLV